MSDRTYIVRTYGCQMNEHDSERIAGLLEADGLRPARDVDHADVVVLNTCCIRENADNKLYGHLGALKALKDTRPELEIVVGVSWTWLFAGETPGRHVLIGGFLVIGSLVANEALALRRRP